MRTPSILSISAIFLFATVAHAQTPQTVDDLKWDLSTAPFDVKKLLRLPPPSRNGADLAINAIAEFATETIRMLPEPQREKRRKVVSERLRHYADLLEALKENPEKVEGATIDAFVAMHAEGFLKLAAARRKPETVFADGIGIAVLLPHIQGTRQAARVSVYKCVRQLERGHVNQAIDTLETVFWLSQTVRRRGYLVNQLVSYAIDSIACESMLNRILAAPQLTPDHCARLVRLLQSRLTETKRSRDTGLRMEYLLMRTTIDGIQHQRYEYARKHLIAELGLRGELTYGQLVTKVLDNGDPDTAKRIDQMRSSDFDRETRQLNKHYQRVVESMSLPYAKRRDTLKKMPRRITDGDGNEYQILSAVWTRFDQFDEAHTNWVARLNGFTALVSAKRWQLTSKDPLPRDLQEIANAAGLKSTPQDPFTDGKPIKLIVQDGNPVAYSIGSDGIDQKAATDWKFGTQPGDFIFRIPHDVHLHSEQ